MIRSLLRGCNVITFLRSLLAPPTALTTMLDLLAHSRPEEVPHNSILGLVVAYVSSPRCRVSHANAFITSIGWQYNLH